MTNPSQPESLAEAAHRIRTATPILGASATDADCVARNTLIGQVLADRGVRAGRRHIWHTAQLQTGQVVGCFADSREEAELRISVWWEADCVWVIPDRELRVHEEYFPPGRCRVRPDSAFPVGPPRHPRDRFAPAPSLLSGLDSPATAMGRG